MVVWTLEDFSKILSYSVHKSLEQYSKIYATTFYKHLTSEVEITILNGQISDEFQGKLNVLKFEKNILDYRLNIGKIVNYWKLQIFGQPIQPGICNTVYEIIDKIDKEFETFVYEIQKLAVQKRWLKDKQKSKEISESSQVFSILPNIECLQN